MTDNRHLHVLGVNENPMHPAAWRLHLFVADEADARRHAVHLHASPGTQRQQQSQEAIHINAEEHDYTYYININGQPQPWEWRRGLRLRPHWQRHDRHWLPELRRDNRLGVLDACRRDGRPRCPQPAQGQDHTGDEYRQQHRTVEAMQGLAAQAEPEQRIEQRQAERPLQQVYDETGCHGGYFFFRSARNCSSSPSVTFSSFTNADTTRMYELPK